MIGNFESAVEKGIEKPAEKTESFFDQLESEVDVEKSEQSKAQETVTGFWNGLESGSFEGDTDRKETVDITDSDKQQILSDFALGHVKFEDAKEVLAECYADIVNSNQCWSWGQNVPGGANLTAGQKKEIKEIAQRTGLIPTIPLHEIGEKVYADFSPFVVFECDLDETDWAKTDKDQFCLCTQMLSEYICRCPSFDKQFSESQLNSIMQKSERVEGYTWHHSEKPGVMQLIPFGIHNITNHCGGRSEGNWADSPRNGGALL